MKRSSLRAQHLPLVFLMISFLSLDAMKGVGSKKTNPAIGDLQKLRKELSRKVQSIKTFQDFAPKFRDAFEVQIIETIQAFAPPLRDALADKIKNSRDPWDTIFALHCSHKKMIEKGFSLEKCGIMKTTPKSTVSGMLKGFIEEINAYDISLQKEDEDPALAYIMKKIRDDLSDSLRKTDNPLACFDLYAQALSDVDLEKES